MRLYNRPERKKRKMMDPSVLSSKLESIEWGEWLRNQVRAVLKVFDPESLVALAPNEIDFPTARKLMIDHGCGAASIWQDLPEDCTKPLVTEQVSVSRVAIHVEADSGGRMYWKAGSKVNSRTPQTELNSTRHRAVTWTATSNVTPQGSR
jgi:hypothetical protein